MNDAKLTALFAATEVGAEPALPAGYAERTLARARSSVRLRRGIGAATLVVCLVALLAIAPWLGVTRGPSPANPPSEPSFPAQFADFSLFTSRATDRPAGRAIALYEYGSSEFFTTAQTLVVGADRDTYRRVDTDSDSAPQLSPDGRYVLYLHPSKGTDEFTLLDLTSGHTSVRHSVEWISNVAGLTMLAWSPDGRYLAYAVPAPPPADGKAASSFHDGEPIRNLAILDINNDSNVFYPAKRPIYSAAFSPDSQRLAVQAGPDSPIVSVRGKKVGTWEPPPGINQYSAIAWSPDGRLMATILSPRPRPDGSTTTNDAAIRFVDMTGTGQPVPPDLAYFTMLGWRSPTHIVVQDQLQNEDSDALIEVSTMDGSRTVLSRFSRKNSCEYGLQRCRVYQIQLATNLIPYARVRPSNPDQGPWVPIVHIGAIIFGVVVASGVAGTVVFRRRRRRRRHRRSATPAP